MSNDTKAQNKKGPKYILNIEGREVPWNDDQITTEQIAELGGWAVAEGVVEVDQDNNEHTLVPGQIIEIKPGQGFGKKHRWKRGLISERIEGEMLLLRQQFPEIEHIHEGGEDWFRIKDYPVPDGWQRGALAVAVVTVIFKITAAYPSGQPYGFLTPADFNFKGTTPNNTSAGVNTPFGTNMLQFSWQPEEWKPAHVLVNGSNLLAWARSFTRRLKEGV